MDIWNGAVVLFLFVVGVSLHRALRPLKDYYVLERRYFERLYEQPWRGDVFQVFCAEGFVDYLAAKALFDRYETIYIETLDHAHQEAEHSLFMVPARSKSAAITRLRMEKAYDKRLLHVTPFSDYSSDVRIGRKKPRQAWLNSPRG